MTAIATAPGEDAPSFRDVLANREFRRLWGAVVSGTLGDSIAQVALPLLVFAITDSEALLGVVFAISTLPKVVLAPVAGLLADRLDRRMILLVSDLARALAVCLLPFAGTAFQIGAIALVIAVFTALSRPAEQAAIPMVAGERLLMRAIALSQVSNAAIRVIGPTIGAGLVAAFGAGPAFYAQAICFVISSYLVWRLRLPAMQRVAESARSLAGELASGFWVMWRRPTVRAIVLAEMVWGGAGTMQTIGFLAYTERTLDLGDAAGTLFALLVATFSAGTVAGGLLSGRVERRLGRSFMLGFGYVAPLLLVVLFFVPPLAVVFIALFFFGLSDSLLVVASQQIFVERIPDAERGRFYATFNAMVTGAWAGWFALLGAMVGSLGAPATFLIVGLAVGFGCPLVLVLTGTIRELLVAERPARTVPTPMA